MTPRSPPNSNQATDRHRGSTLTPPRNGTLLAPSAQICVSLEEAPDFGVGGDRPFSLSPTNRDCDNCVAEFLAQRLHDSPPDVHMSQEQNASALTLRSGGHVPSSHRPQPQIGGSPSMVVRTTFLQRRSASNVSSRSWSAEMRSTPSVSATPSAVMGRRNRCVTACRADVRWDR